MNVSQTTIDDIKKISAEKLADHNALHRIENKYDEYICPLCGNGEGNDATGIKPHVTDSYIGWKCQRCSEKFDNITILAVHYSLNPKNDFKEICQKACDEFNISYIEEYHSRDNPTNKTQGTKSTNNIRHSELGIINEDLAHGLTELKNFTDKQGGTWRGLPFELLKKKGCRFIKNWLPPSLLAKRTDAKN